MSLQMINQNGRCDEYECVREKPHNYRVVREYRENYCTMLVSGFSICACDDPNYLHMIGPYMHLCTTQFDFHVNEINGFHTLKPSVSIDISQL